MAKSGSLVFGTKDDVLYTKPVGTLVGEQSKKYGSKTALVSSWQKFRCSFEDLDKDSANLAKALLDLKIRPGHHIGIFAGNRYEYIQVFLAAARIGRPLVVLNSMFSPRELGEAVTRSECRAVFVASNIGKRDITAQHFGTLGECLNKKGALLKNVIVLGDKAPPEDGFETWGQFLQRAQSVFSTENILKTEERAVRAEHVVNLQFTSGTTGQPKAAMLTHINMINNGRLNGVYMRLTDEDIICCPPPLFHCFGITMGFLNALITGCTIVFPSDEFDAERVVDALIAEKPTALLGVPTMILAELDVIKRRGLSVKTIRTGLAAGSPVPRSLMSRIKKELECDGMIIAYGMTETSPVTFATSLDDPDHIRLTALGRVLPHTGAKVIDEKGNILPRGERGELCTSGYALQKGYFKNQAKTDEAMKRDENGILWMHTGDQCYIDEDSYCFFAGRIKDIIIRGGENIYPREIEDRLLAHSSISEASVAGIKDDYYGEVVAAWLRLQSGAKRPDDEEIRNWVRSELARHKAPQHVFWIGDKGVGDDFPKTASGKHQKHILSDRGYELVKQKAPQAKL